MADANRVVRQWLETDAALGVSDVPLRVASQASDSTANTTAGGATAPVSARPGAVAARPAAQPSAPPARESGSAFAVRQTPVAAPRPAAPATPVRSAPPLSSSPIPARSLPVPAKKSVMLPPVPVGNVWDLPPITRAQKEAAFAKLAEQINAFAAPLLGDIATRAVFGEGDCDAELMFIGEGPGVEEDRTGRPFVGRSGQLLDKMIGAIGYQRAQVFIGNIVKLRAADWTEDGGRLQDRPPTPEEVARWIPFLHRQIEIIRPKVIVTLGAPAVKYLTGTTEGVMKIRGTWLAYRGIPVMPTYHPAFVLRAYTEENRRKVWNDLKAAKGRVRGE